MLPVSLGRSPGCRPGLQGGASRQGQATGSGPCPAHGSSGPKPLTHAPAVFPVCARCPRDCPKGCPWACPQSLDTEAHDRAQRTGTGHKVWSVGTEWGETEPEPEAFVQKKPQHVPVQMPRGKLRRLCICGPEQDVGESLKAPCIPMSDIP